MEGGGGGNDFDRIRQGTGVVRPSVRMRGRGEEGGHERAGLG
jgi:hypothetical protein